MTHYMKLNPEPFDKIASGKKTIELRLYDEKRKTVLRVTKSFLPIFTIPIAVSA